MERNARRPVQSGLVRLGACLLSAGLINAVACLPAAAQAWPNRPVTVVIPLAPGGPIDAEGRVYNQKLTEALGQPFVLDYKVGAGGLVGLQYAARATPDGYNLLIGSSNFTIIPAVNRSPGFDILKDFAPISLMTKKASVLLVYPGLAAKSLPELIAYAKANPEKLNFGTTGAGGATELAGRFLASASGMPLTFVHYKGTGPLTVDLIAGRVHLAITNLFSGMALVKSGKLRTLGVTSTVRQAGFPDLPTLTENGAPGYEYVGWSGYLAPAGTPQPIISRLSGELAKIARAEDVKKKLGDDIDFIGSGPDELRKHLAAELGRWQKVVKEAGIKPEE
jgi:tripartite-type tricarboxylate transporter receptor subunit TctC